MLILKCIKTIHILRSWSNYTHCLDKEDASFLLTINQVRSVFPNLFHSVQVHFAVFIVTIAIILNYILLLKWQA